MPHIFHACPKYLSSRKFHRKSPKKRFGIQNEGKNRNMVPNFNMQPKVNPLIERLKLKSLPIPINEALENVSKISLPPHWSHSEDSAKIAFMHSPTGDVFKIDRSVTFSKEKIKDIPQSPSVHFNGVEVNAKKIIRTKEELQKYLKEIHAMKLCPGTDIQNKKHSSCPQVVSHRFTTQAVRCKFCQSERKRLLRHMKRERAGKIKKQKQSKAKCAKILRMKKKILSLKNEIKFLQDKMSKMGEEAEKKLLDSLSEEKQKEVVKAIIMASKCKPRNRRYSNEWIYECILMRIKSSALYRKMLRDNLLPLPSLRTIQRFMAKLKPQFGFHEATFQLMGQKSVHYSEEERHGTLQIDEMAVQENIEFNKNSGQVHGMVDLGSASPPDADTTLGDHALVILFQPFKGIWFQALGAFCSRGAAKGPELEKLITEAIILLYKHNYYVDAVVTDGGSWNRNMWSLFGITEHQVSCMNPAEIPKDSEEYSNEDQNEQQAKDSNPPRRLWFLSDFPHLVKSMWSRVRTTKKLQTPEGEVKLDHWKILADADDERHTHINICHKLTPDHVEPSNWQCMNVQMAFQFFQYDVADGMEYYRDVAKVQELQDCHATVAFIRKVARLRKAMNAKNRWDSLRDEAENESRKAIAEFLDYLQLWKQKVPKTESRLAWQTEHGLTVTLKATLDLCHYLTSLGFKYLMTRRLNQDPLEHFFGKIRQACGSNQHPDPTQFIQVYRLLSTASLIKPPRGSNVSGGEMLNALTSLADLIGEEDLEKKAKLEEELDKILDQGDEENLLEKHMFCLSDDGYFESAPSSQNQMSEHSYNNNTKINPHAFQMFGGYVARKLRNYCTAKHCESCFNSLSRPTDAPAVPTQSLIEKKSRGFLLRPSTHLYNLMVKVEDTILTVLGRTKMNRHILWAVVEELHNAEIYSEIGCDVHAREMTKAALVWYMNTRLIFACKRYVRTETVIKKRKVKAKNLMKKCKLNAVPVENNLPVKNILPVPSVVVDPEIVPPVQNLIDEQNVDDAPPQKKRKVQNSKKPKGKVRKVDKLQAPPQSSSKQVPEMQQQATERPRRNHTRKKKSDYEYY